MRVCLLARLRRSLRVFGIRVFGFSALQPSPPRPKTMHYCGSLFPRASDHQPSCGAMPSASPRIRFKPASPCVRHSRNQTFINHAGRLRRGGPLLLSQVCLPVCLMGHRVFRHFDFGGIPQRFRVLRVFRSWNATAREPVSGAPSMKRGSAERFHSVVGIAAVGCHNGDFAQKRRRYDDPVGGILVVSG